MTRLRNQEGDLAMVINQSSDLKHLEGLTGTCLYYSYRKKHWYFETQSDGVYTFRDCELLPLGGEHVLASQPKPELKTGAVAYVG